MCCTLSLIDTLHLLSYSLTHSLTHSLTRLLTYSLTLYCHSSSSCGPSSSSMSVNDIRNRITVDLFEVVSSCHHSIDSTHLLTHYAWVPHYPPTLHLSAPVSEWGGTVCWQWGLDNPAHTDRLKQSVIPTRLSCLSQRHSLTHSLSHWVTFTPTYLFHYLTWVESSQIPRVNTHYPSLPHSLTHSLTHSSLSSYTEKRIHWKFCHFYLWKWKSHTWKSFETCRYATTWNCFLWIQCTTSLRTENEFENPITRNYCSESIEKIITRYGNFVWFTW